MDTPNLHGKHPYWNCRTCLDGFFSSYVLVSPFSLALPERPSGLLVRLGRSSSREGLQSYVVQHEAQKKSKDKKHLQDRLTCVQDCVVLLGMKKEYETDMIPKYPEVILISEKL